MARKTIDKTGLKVSKNGASGAALATMYIKAAEEKINAEVKEKVSLKERLMNLVPLSLEDHKEFRAAMKARYDTVKAADYSEDGESNAASLKATLSMWQRMSAAVETGWKPDTKKPWATLTQEATDAKNAQAAAEATARINEKIKAIVADASKPEKIKEAEITLLQATIPAETAGPSQTRSAVGRKRAEPKSVYDQVYAIIDPLPLQELEKLHHQLGLLIEARKSKTVKAVPNKAQPGVAFTPEAEHATASKNPANERRSKANKHNQRASVR